MRVFTRCIMSEQDAPNAQNPMSTSANDPLEALKSAQAAIKAAQAMQGSGAIASPSPSPMPAAGAIGGPKVSEEEAEAAMLAAMGMSPIGGGATNAGVTPTSSGNAPQAKAFAMPDLGGGSGAKPPEAIDMLGDVNLHVKIELGRTRMLVEDVLRLGEGSVVELDKLAGDPVDVFVNDRPVARGEVLVLNDNFCVRISEIIRSQD